MKPVSPKHRRRDKSRGGRMCSCFMCGHVRKHEGVTTQEKKALDSFKAQLDGDPERMKIVNPEPVAFVYERDIDEVS